jgi:hypothetical protein
VYTLSKILLSTLTLNSIVSASQLIVQALNFMNASEVETEFLNLQMETLLNRVKDYGQAISLNLLEILMMDLFSIMK